MKKAARSCRESIERNQSFWLLPNRKMSPNSDSMFEARSAHSGTYTSACSAIVLMFFRDVLTLQLALMLYASGRICWRSPRRLHAERLLRSPRPLALSHARD